MFVQFTDYWIVEGTLVFCMAALTLSQPLSVSVCSTPMCLEGGHYKALIPIPHTLLAQAWSALVSPTRTSESSSYAPFDQQGALLLPTWILHPHTRFMFEVGVQVLSVSS